LTAFTAAQGPAALEGRVQAADVSSMKTDELRQRRRLFLLALVGDLIGVAVVLTLGLEALLVAIVAVGLLLPTLSMLAWMTARIRSAEAYSTEAERLGHHELVPDRDGRQ
jgi:FtsH-binding integral membrane protein